MNLSGIVVPGERVAAVPGKYLHFRNGIVAGDQVSTAESVAAETPRREHLPRYQQPGPAMPATEAPALTLFQ
jgi:hypothetical protein